MKPEILETKPQELRFIFELKKQSSCSVQLINKTDQHVGFKVKTTTRKKYCVRPNTGVIDPSSSCEFTATMQGPTVAPPDLVCRDKFLVLSTFVPEGTKEEDITSQTFAKENGKTVDEKRLKVVLIRAQESLDSSPINETLKLVQKNDSRELKDDVVQKHSSHAKVDVGIEMSKGEGESLEATRREETMKRKDEDVKRKEESVKRSKEFIKRNSEPMQVNDTEELRLVKDLEETKSKVKELESKLSEVQGNDEILRELREIKAEIAWMRRVEEMKARYEKARDEVIKNTWRLQDIKLLSDYPSYPQFDDLPGEAERPYSPLRGTGLQSSLLCL